MANYYNEIEPYAAQWLRNLIQAGHIPDGVVDERSIEDVTPDDLRGFVQCHFFAGLGGWPLALRNAGVPDDYPLWTGSCPCQPFSAAGKGGGFADERHLWPAFDWLISQCRPDLVLGEQVEGPAGRKWLDLVATDLEGHGYAFGAAVFPAAGVGAPQIRHRTYWVADAGSERCNGEQIRIQPRSPRQDCVEAARSGGTGRLGDGSSEGLAQRVGVGRVQSGTSDAHTGQAAIVGSDSGGLASANEGQRGRLASGVGSERDRQARGWQQGDGGASVDCEAGGVADSARERRREECADTGWEPVGDRAQRRRAGLGASGGDCRGGPVNGFWGASDWLYCRDDKWRPVEPSTFPLASGISNRVGRLRAYGNAICVPQAVAFIQALDIPLTHPMSV